MGSAMSITAFPVLARILMERNLLHSRVGTLSVACAAVDDITGWCMMACIVMLGRSQTGGKPAWVTIGGSLFYVLVMICGVKPLLSRFAISFRKHGCLTDSALALMIGLALISGLTTEWLGIHFLFGAFLMGAIMPPAADLIQSVLRKLEPFIVVVLLPLFFALSGLRASVGLVRGRLFPYTLLIIGVAIAGKIGGSMVAARMAGLRWRDATSLGILMNTRGLMEIIILNIGLDVGVISTTAFTMMVLMALVTTLMTSPLLAWVYPMRVTVSGSTAGTEFPGRHVPEVQAHSVDTVAS
jgi:Kef-type K+ transport system membrane component KefB